MVLMMLMLMVLMVLLIVVVMVVADVFVDDDDVDDGVGVDVDVDVDVDVVVVVVAVAVVSAFFPGIAVWDEFQLHSEMRDYFVRMHGACPTAVDRTLCVFVRRRCWTATPPSGCRASTRSGRRRPAPRCSRRSSS